MKIKLSRLRFLSLIVIVVESLAIGLSILISVLYKDSFYLFFAALFIFALIQNFRKKKVHPEKKTESYLSKKPTLQSVKQNIKSKKIDVSPLKKNILLYSLSAITFSILAAVSMEDVGLKRNLIVEYYLRLCGIVLNQWWIPLLLVILITAILTRKNKSIVNIKSIGKDFINGFGLLILGFASSIMSTFVLALIYILVVSLSSLLFPTALGIVNTPEQIISTINDHKETPQLASINDTSKENIVCKTNIFIKKGSFFSNQIIPSFPEFSFLLVKIPKDQVFMVQNTIFFRSLEKDVIEKISPTIAKKYVSSIFNPRYIKDLPNIYIVSRQEYLKYRDEQIDKQLEEIQEYIEEIKKEMNYVASLISKGKSYIATMQNYIQEATNLRDSEYQYCMTATYTYYGYYQNYTYRYYSDAKCQAQKQTREQEIKTYQSNLSEEQNTLSHNQGVYASYKSDLEDFGTYQDFVNSFKSQTPYELGLFEPEKDIRVVLDSIDSKSLADFISTLSHEYLHYTSYISEERSLPQFFEEGLTEMFARMVGRETTGTSTNVGYPLVTKVMERIADKVGWSELEQIYFTKNKEELIALLDSKFGKDFYIDSESFFIIIPYLSEEKALKYANNIMLRIDSPPLTKEDFYSIESSF